MISAELLDELIGAVGAENAIQDDLDRIVHTYGKSVRDLLRLRAGDIPRVPDVVVYPADEAEVQLIVDYAVAADAVLIPYGGGSNISGSLHAPEDETRSVISVDLGRLNKLISIDEESGLARIQARVQGPDLEKQLITQGWTLPPFGTEDHLADARTRRGVRQRTNLEHLAWHDHPHATRDVGDVPILVRLHAGGARGNPAAERAVAEAVRVMP